MHDLVVFQLPTGCWSTSAQFVSIVTDISVDLTKLQMAVLAQNACSDQADAEVRHNVERLLECRPTSEAELNLTGRALDLIEQVLGIESDCHRALSRHLGRPPHKDDPADF